MVVKKELHLNYNLLNYQGNTIINIINSINSINNIINNIINNKIELKYCFVI